MMLRAIAFLSVLLIASQAHALSCKRPSAADAFGVIEVAPEPYWIVVGEISGGPGEPMKGDRNGPVKHRTYEAVFSGHNMNRNGLANPINIGITVTENCVGQWCPNLAREQKVLTFLRLEASGVPSLEINACMGNVFYDPTAAQLDEIKQCFVSGCAK